MKPFTNLNILTSCHILITVYWFSGISDVLTFKTVAHVFNESFKHPSTPAKSTPTAVACSHQ